MADEQVQGISLGLTLDPSGFSSGIARAKRDLAGLATAAQNIQIGVGVGAVGRAGRQATNVPGPQAVLPGGTPIAPRVSPHFQVSAGAVRDLRTDINAQMRQFAAQGEAVAIPIRLGRVPYAAMRAEIAAGIGEVPIKVAIDPRSIAIAIGQLSTGIVTGTAQTKGIPRRAAGGGVEANRPVIVGEPGPEVFIPTTNGRISRTIPQARVGTMVGARDLAQYPQASMVRHLERLAASLTPQDIKIGQTWHAMAQGQVLRGAQLEGFLPQGRLGTMGRGFSADEQRILRATAAVSPQMKWWANLAHSRAIARAAVQGGLPTKAVADSFLPWVQTQVGVNRKLASGVMGLSAREMGQAMRLIAGEDPDVVLRSVKGYPLPKVHPFSRNMTGDLKALTLDTIAAQTATSGLSSWKSGAGYSQAPPPGLFRDAMSAAHYEVYGQYEKQFPKGIAQFQAALWAKYRGDAFARGGSVRRLLSQGSERFGARAQSSYGKRWEGFATAFGNLYGRGQNARGMLGKAMRSEGREAQMSEPIDLMTALEDFAANPSAPRERGVSQLGRLKEMFNPREDQPRMADLTQHMFRWLETARFPGAQSLLGRAIKTHAGIEGSNERILKTLAHLPEKPNIVPFTRPWSTIPVAWSRGKGDLPTGMIPAGDVRLTHERRPTVTDEGKMILNPLEGLQGDWSEFQRGALGEFGRNARGGLVGRWSGGRAEAYRRTIEQGGGTFDPKGMQPKKGYAVGLAQGTAAMVSEEDRLGFIRGFRQQGKAGAPFVGTWLNEGNIHIDPVDVLKRKREAIKLGIGNEQLAIYDLLRGEEISTRKRYRGGPTLGETYPNAFISLKNLDRARRLQVGKRALELGQQYPTTAKNIMTIEAFTPLQMSGRTGSSSDIGYTERARSGWQSSKIGLNRGFSDEAIDQDMASGWGLSKDMADIFTHEFGHAYSIANTANYMPYAADIPARKMMKGLRAPSRYGASDPEEKFAELFLMHQKTGAFPNLFSKKYRGGPALKDVFPGGVDLSKFERSDRLAIGKALYGAGREFPFTAQRIAEIKGVDIYDFAKRFGPEEASQTAGMTTGKPAYEGLFSNRMVGIGPPSIFLNPHGVSVETIKAMGALPKTWADVATHEFGHAIDYAHGFISGELDVAGAPLTGTPYASRSIREKFAELFLHGRRGGSTSGLMETVQDVEIEQMSKLRGAMKAGLTREKFMKSLMRINVDPMRVGRAAGGDQSRSGMYIVNELGREKFVPKSREGEIPPSVARRIPGGDQIGLTSTGKGAIQDIPGHGARLWSAPEDGWIIPAHLTQKVPHAQTGRRVGGAGGGSESRDDFRARVAAENAAEDAARAMPPQGYARGGIDEPTFARQERERQEQTGPAPRRPRRGGDDSGEIERRALRRSRAEAEGSLRVSRDVRPGVSGFNAEINAGLANARINEAAIRGLTGRAALGGFLASATGGRERRAARFEAQATRAELMATLPKGAEGKDPQVVWQERLKESQKVAETASQEQQRLNQRHGEGSVAARQQAKSVNLANEAVSKNAQMVQRVNDLRVREQQALARASGGAVQNFAAVTAAGFAFNVGMQAVSVGMEMATQVVAPMVDQINGFSGVSSRVQRDLADAQRELGGDTGAAVARAAGRAGVGGRGAEFLEAQLGGGISGRAGALAAADASQLFLGALGAGNTSQGLFSGFGGVGGGGFLAQFLGGGAGLTEVLAGDIEKFRGAQGAATQLSQRVVGTPTSIMGGVRGINMGPGGVRQTTVTPADIAKNEADAALALETLTVYTNDQNEAAARGANALNTHTEGIHLATREQLGLTQAQAEAAEDVLKVSGAADPNLLKFTGQGVFLVDKAGKPVSDPEQYKGYFEQLALGRTVESRATFMRTRERGLQAQIGTAAVRGGVERDTFIPGQLGQQLAAQPFMSAMSGIADASMVTLTNLGEVQQMQDAVTRQAEEGIRKQAEFITANIGAAEGLQFTGLMDQVRAYGETIAGINEQLANQQAQLSAKQYANNLRIINRQIGEARGLAGMSGGSRLGQVQREQFMLGRAAEALQLAAQELQIALSQRQINFQRAIAGFQAPGITGEERAARMEEAKIEADFAQQQLDLQKAQLGIAQQAFPLGLEVFKIQTQVAVQDLEAQKQINALSFSLEQEQIAAQKRIAVLTIAQGQLQAEAMSLFNQATNNFDTRLGIAAQYAAQFGGTMSYALTVVGNALARLQKRLGTGGENPLKEELQTGWLGTVNQATDITVGEAGVETVAVLRNPRRGMLAPSGGGGGGMSVVLTITINDPVVRDDSDLDRLARRTAEVVEERLGVKAGMLGG